MAEAFVSPNKQRQQALAMARLGISEEDLTEKFVLGSGAGGQKVNKTSSCVHLRHEPTGIVVKCQRCRSRALNRYYARQALCERIAEQIAGQKSARQQLREKIRRQKRRRSRRQKEKMLAEKKKQSSKKRLRKSVNGNSQD